MGFGHGRAQRYTWNTGLSQRLRVKGSEDRGGDMREAWNDYKIEIHGDALRRHSQAFAATSAKDSELKTRLRLCFGRNRGLTFSVVKAPYITAKSLMRDLLDIVTFYLSSCIGEAHRRVVDMTSL